jgi:Txe/YoeB family toxin of Txe-Axe toxin-antitoxin module
LKSRQIKEFQNQEEGTAQKERTKTKQQSNKSETVSQLFRDPSTITSNYDSLDAQTEGFWTIRKSSERMITETGKTEVQKVDLPSATSAHPLCTSYCLSNSILL